MRGTLLLCLLLAGPVSMVAAGTYQCSVSDAEAGYLTQDFQRNPAFPTKKAYIQNQLDQVLTQVRDSVAKGAAYRAKIEAAVLEPTSQKVACTVSATDEAFLATLPGATTTQGMVNRLLAGQFKRVRDSVQRSQKGQVLDAAWQCVNDGKAFTIARNAQTQAFQWSCQ